MNKVELDLYIACSNCALHGYDDIRSELLAVREKAFKRAARSGVSLERMAEILEAATKDMEVV